MNNVNLIDNLLAKLTKGKTLAEIRANMEAINLLLDNRLEIDKKQ